MIHLANDCKVREMAEPEKSPPGIESEKVTENGTTPTPDIETAPAPLARRLEGRHMQMIAIGGSIGETNCTINCWENMLTLSSKALVSSSDQVQHSRVVVQRLY